MRKQIREIRVLDIHLYFTLSLVLIPVIWVGYWLLGAYVNLPFKVIYTLPVFIIATIPVTKRLIIGTVLLYKSFAPMSVRKKCRFTPSCSTYMIMALNKYGLFIGLFKGICRIFRCKPPNGGEDYP